MPNIICPLLGEGRNCVLNKCAWFYHFPNKSAKAGICSVLHLATWITGINARMAAIKSSATR